MLSDWKAYFDPPCGVLTTTAMEFATQQKAVSIFDSVSVAWNGCGKLVKTRILVIAEVLDHTAEATNITIADVCDSSSRNTEVVTGREPNARVRPA